MNVEAVHTGAERRRLRLTVAVLADVVAQADGDVAGVDVYRQQRAVVETERRRKPDVAMLVEIIDVA